jgi:hypothetical protein
MKENGGRRSDRHRASDPTQAVARPPQTGHTGRLRTDRNQIDRLMALRMAPRRVAAVRSFKGPAESPPPRARSAAQTTAPP